MRIWNCFFCHSSSLTDARLFSSMVMVIVWLALASGAAAQTVPAVPTGLVAKQIGPRHIMITWNNPGDNSITEYQYCAIGSLDTSRCTWILIDSSGSSTVSHTFSLTEEVPEKKTFTVFVRARNEHGFSDVNLRADGFSLDVYPLPEIRILDERNSRISRLEVEEGRKMTFKVGLPPRGDRLPMESVTITITTSGDPI